ncbi:MAG TPA: zinc-ribbon domain containing protein [Polyangia bacterium]|jgi:CxxC-x17-CxxC domain-containing protein
MDFQDRALQCIDCKNEFTFTAGEQEFYARKGFRETPKRCKPCREARKVRGPRPSRELEPPRDRELQRGPQREREMFDAVCAACGAPARVPFRPASGRPVYCRECYSSRQGQGSGYGGGY